MPHNTAFSTVQFLARRLLAFACLLGGPLVVMADEFPKDTNKITSLTAEQAKRLVAEVKVDVSWFSVNWNREGKA